MTASRQPSAAGLKPIERVTRRHAEGVLTGLFWLAAALIAGVLMSALLALHDRRPQPALSLGDPLLIDPATAAPLFSGTGSFAA